MASLKVWWPACEKWLNVRFHDPEGLLSYPHWLSVRAECVRRIGERVARNQLGGTCKGWCYKGTGRFTEYRFDWLVEHEFLPDTGVEFDTYFIRVGVWEVYYHRLSTVAVHRLEGAARRRYYILETKHWIGEPVVDSYWSPPTV